MSAGWTGTGLGVRADVRVLRVHYGREGLLPGRRVRLPARGGPVASDRRPGPGRASSVPHCWPPSRSALPRRYWPGNLHQARWTFCVACRPQNVSAAK